MLGSFRSVKADTVIAVKGFGASIELCSIKLGFEVVDHIDVGQLLRL
jgi:hypothetical protein